MRRHILLKTAGAVLSAILIASFLVVDAQGIAPSVPWPYLALLGFVVFAALVGWTLWGANRQIRELEQEKASRRPWFALGPNTSASTRVREDKNRVDVLLRPRFRNGGDRPAYQLSVRGVHAPVTRPDMFTAKQLTILNPVAPGEEFGPDIPITMNYVQQEGEKRMVISKEIVLFCDIQYSDAPSEGNWYEDKWWFVYPLGAPSLAAAYKEHKEALEPYVERAFNTIEAH